MSGDADKTLRDAFAWARDAEGGEAPAFARVLAEARKGRRHRRRGALRLALAGVGAVMLVLVLLRRPVSLPEETHAPSVMDWRSPTDFLLQTPGREVLEAPALGGGLPDYSRIPGLDGLSPDPSERRRSS
ncbi:MAG TPA: hypothetical protein VN083_10235 [Vicinamibacteria bacterium]|nr:hypothetical protein [Vicinamibacteria bacterium]